MKQLRNDFCIFVISHNKPDNDTYKQLQLCNCKYPIYIVIDDKVLHVSQTMQRLRITEGNSSQKTRILIGDAKSSSSDRYIPLTDYAIALCRQREIEDPEAFVLTGDAKKYMEPRTLHNHLSKICQSCGLKDVHFHTLRHYVECF